MTTIYCCNCEKDIEARLTNGAEVYPHRNDLAELPFWKCDACEGIVGCHHKTNKPTTPLGVIPSPLIKRYRSHIHTLLDPLWRGGRYGRRALYGELGKVLGRVYHTAELRTPEECTIIIKYLEDTYHPYYLNK